MSPKWTGLELVTSRLVASRITVGKSVSGPADPLWNTAGAVGGTTMLKLVLTPAGVCTTITTSPIAWNGICALTCVGETKISGIGWPFTVRQLLAKAVGKGIVLVARLVGLSELPNTEIKPPGAAGDMKSAPLTTALICGGGSDAA